MRIRFGLKAGLLLTTAILACRQPAPAAAAPAKVLKEKMDTQSLLKKWAGIPDLLLVAREQAKGGDAYALLPKLEKEYRDGKKPFRLTTLFRHLEQCANGEHSFAASTILIVNAKGDSVKTTGLAMHEVVEHHAEIPKEISSFLKGLL